MAKHYLAIFEKPGKISIARAVTKKEYNVLKNKAQIINDKVIWIPYHAVLITLDQNSLEHDTIQFIKNNKNANFIIAKIPPSNIQQKTFIKLEKLVSCWDHIITRYSIPSTLSYEV